MQCVHWALVDRFLSAGPSSPVPNHHSMKDKSVYALWRQETCMDLVDSFRWAIPQRNTNWGFSFFFLISQTCFFFSPTQKNSPSKNKFFFKRLGSELIWFSRYILLCLKEMKQLDEAQKMRVAQATPHTFESEDEGGTNWQREWFCGVVMKQSALWIFFSILCKKNFSIGHSLMNYSARGKKNLTSSYFIYSDHFWSVVGKQEAQPAGGLWTRMRLNNNNIQRSSKRSSS